MFNKKEIVWLIISIIIFSFIIAFPSSFTVLPILAASLILLTNLVVKKLASKYYSVNIQQEIWTFQRYGIYEKAKLKKPFPIGLILPFVLTIFSLGIIKPLIFLQFKSKPSKKRILKKRGINRYSEVNETDLAGISMWGFWSLILLSILGAILNFPELTKYSIYYGLWNLLPISNLDGTKLFFGNIFNWTLLVIANIIAITIIIL